MAAMPADICAVAVAIAALACAWRAAWASVARA